MYFVDTHCHLDLLTNIRDRVAVEDNLSIKTIAVTNSPTFFKPNKELFAGCKNIRVALGLHPELVMQFHNKLNVMEEHIHSTRYIGEIGLDGSKDFSQTFDLQLRTLKSIFALIQQAGNKILTVHTRNAVTPTISLLNQYLSASTSKVILHWYTGNLSDLRKALDYGYFFSVNHKMLLSRRSRELLLHVPTEKLLTETDAPFTFDNNDSERMSSLLATIDGLAAIKKCSAEFIKEMVYENFKQLLE